MHDDSCGGYRDGPDHADVGGNTAASLRKKQSGLDYRFCEDLVSTLEFDFLIVGGGCIGSSILYELSARGIQNLALVDSGRKTTSATANSGGMLRVFHEHIEHLELALASTKHIARLQRKGVLTEQRAANGSLYFFNKRRYPEYQHNLQHMNESGYPFEVITSVNGRRRFPQFRWNDEEWAIFEPRGSSLSPGLFVEDLLRASQNTGAMVLDGVEVTRVCSYRDHYRAVGPNGVILAKNLILAGGAKTLPRLNDLGLSVQLDIKTLQAFSSDANHDVEVLPNFFDRETLQFARFGKRVVVSHEDLPRVIEPFWRRPMELMSAEDAYAPNRIGFAGEIAGYPRLNVATGWGGTGFKFALEIGNRVANTIGQANSRRIGMWARGYAT